MLIAHLPPKAVSTALLPVLTRRTLFLFSCTSRPVANEEPYTTYNDMSTHIWTYV